MKSRRENRVQYVLIIAAILYSGYALAATSNRVYALSIYFVVFGMLTIRLMNTHFRISADVNIRVNLLFVVLWGAILLFNCLLHGSESVSGYISYFLYPLFAYIITSCVSFEQFRIKYMRIIVATAIVSILFFFIIQNTAIFNLFPTFYGLDSNNVLSAKYRGFFAYYSLDPLRNNGIFWEPGIFASHITFCLLLIDWHELKDKIAVLALLVVTLLTTASSAGYLLLVLLLVFWMSTKISSSNNSLTNILGTVIILITLVGVIIAFLNLGSILSIFGLDNDLRFTKILNISENSRSLSMVWCWERFLEKPLLGYGINGLSVHNTLGVSATTTTSTRLLGTLGITGVLYTLMIVRGVWSQKNLSVLSRIILLTMFLMIVNKENHDYFVVTWMIIFYLNSNQEVFHTSSNMRIDEDI